MTPEHIYSGGMTDAKERRSLSIAFVALDWHEERQTKSARYLRAGARDLIRGIVQSVREVRGYYLGQLGEETRPVVNVVDAAAFVYVGSPRHTPIPPISITTNTRGSLGWMMKYGNGLKIKFGGAGSRDNTWPLSRRFPTENYKVSLSSLLYGVIGLPAQRRLIEAAFHQGPMTEGLTRLVERKRK